MAFARSSSMRGALRAVQTSRPSLARPQLWRQAIRRSYASGGHEHAKAGSDLPWAIGAIAVTVPSCWYLMQSAPEEAHHGSHGADHGKEHHEEHKEEPKEEEAKEEAASESGDEPKAEDTPETSEDEADTKTEASDDAAEESEKTK